MSRSGRASNSAPISLFSFQDIITCTSGILIILVLAMALEILTRKPGEKQRDQPTVEISEQMDYSTAIAQAKEDIVLLEARLKDSTPEKGTESLEGSSPAVLIQELVREETRHEDLQRRRKELAERLAAVQAVQSFSETQNSEASKQERALSEQRDELRKSLQELLAFRRITLIPDKVGAKTPIVVECSAQHLRVGRLGQGQDAQVLSVRGFERYLVGRSPAREYFVFMIKPSAARTAWEALRFAQRKGFDVGYDPMEEDEKIVFKDGI